MAAKTRFKDADMQSVIGWVLRLGVIVSVSIVIFGGIVYLYRHGGEAPNHKNFITQPSFVQLNGIIQGIIDFHGRSIIQAGIILLIATPILRIIFSTISFALERDRLYVAISLVVLLIIVLSSLSGHIG